MWRGWKKNKKEINLEKRGGKRRNTGADDGRMGQDEENKR